MGNKPLRWFNRFPDYEVARNIAQNNVYLQYNKFDCFCNYQIQFLTSDSCNRLGKLFENLKFVTTFIIKKSTSPSSEITLTKEL